MPCRVTDGAAAMSGGDSLFPALQAELRALPYGIEKAVRAVRALPAMEDALRDIALDMAQTGMAEELCEKVKVALDILDGGDGAIYR